MSIAESTTESTMEEHLASATPGTLPLNLEVVDRSGPRTDLDGLRLTGPQGGTVYLIDLGYRRPVPNVTTYNNLFRDWNGIIRYLDIDKIPEGKPLLDGAILFNPTGGGSVYMIDVGGKRHVVSPAAMDKYHFNWHKIVHIPQIIIRSIPNGPVLK